MKKELTRKELTRGEFINSLCKVIHSFTDDNVKDIDRYYKIKGGRGAIQDIQRMLNEELKRTALQSSLVLDVSDLQVVKRGDIPKHQGELQSNKVFISGLGTLELIYEKSFDLNNISGEQFGGLFLESFYYNLHSENDERITTLSTIRDLSPFQEIKEYTDKIKNHLEEVNDLIEKIEKVNQ